MKFFFITCSIFLTIYSNECLGQYLNWAFTIGNYSYSATCRSVAVDNANSVYVTGNFYGTVDFDPSVDTFEMTATGFADAFIAKYNDLGELIWAFQIAGNEVKGLDIAVDGFGNIYVTGFYGGQDVDFDPSPTSNNKLSSPWSYNAFLAKYDTDGNHLWAIDLGHLNHKALGNGIAITRTGDVCIIGEFIGFQVDFDPDPNANHLLTSGGAGEEIFLAKFQSNGDFKWAFSLGSGGRDKGYNVDIDNTDNIYITGIFQGYVDFNPDPNISNMIHVGSGNDYDIFVAKYNRDGNYIWAFPIGSTEDDRGSDIKTDAQGNVFVTGSFRGTDVDFDPDPLSTYKMSTPNTWENAFVAKYTTHGAFEWAKNKGDNNRDYGWRITTDILGNVFATGRASNSQYTIKYDTQGNTLWEMNISNGNSYGLAVQNDDVFYLTGSFDGTDIDFNPNGTTYNLTSLNHENAFITKYSEILINVNTYEERYLNTFQLQVFPNPTTGILTLSDVYGTVNIFNTIGQCVHQVYLDEQLSTIDVHHLESGFYILTLEEEDGNIKSTQFIKH